MAISRIPKDYIRLIADHRALRERLADACTTEQAYRTHAKNLLQEISRQECSRILAQIPVEELNRDKRGIRVKTLRDGGYETVADLERASESELEALSGISAEGAAQIKLLTEELREKAASGVRIRLRSDDRTEQTTGLLVALHAIRLGREPGRISQDLCDRYGAEIDKSIDRLQPAKNGLRWLFTSREKKEQAVQAYEFLNCALSGEYGTRAQEALRRMEKAGPMACRDPWGEYEKNAVSDLQDLEQLCPGVLGEEDEVSGLPEGLAAEIQQQRVDLTGLRCRLRRYQEWGVKYILHQQRVLLGDEMGLGKTVQAIAAMISRRNTGATHFLVVSPASVLENWCREIRRHSDLTVQKIHGDDREAALAGWLEDGGVAVTTYETTGIFQLPEAFRISMAVIDEAHYVKNPEAQRTQHVRMLCSQAESVLFMTGTALENRVDEMIELIGVLQPRLARQVRELASLSAAPQFREAIAPVYYRRRREDVLKELPDLIESREWCTMGEEETRCYESAVLGQNFAAARRVSWNVEDPRRSSKAGRMLELVEAAADENRKVIVFSFFLDTLDTVTKLLGSRCLMPITGAVSPEKRQEIVDSFTAAPAGTVLAAQIQAGGTGLNIQSASVVILCEPQLKPSVEHQAISRAYRMGQTRSVLVYRLLCEDSVDEQITALLERKQKSFDAFADESVAAQDSLELDQKTLGALLQQEAARIEAKNAQPQSGPETFPLEGNGAMTAAADAENSVKPG